MNDLKIEVISGLGSKAPAAIVVEYAGVRLLLDAGGLLENDQPQWQMPERLDAVLLSHNHFDHIGNVENIPDHIPIYCTAVTAKSLPANRLIHIISVKGVFNIGSIQITTGASGHAYGGIWFHLDCAGGLFYSGDFSFESLLFQFDQPPPAHIALLDASYGLFDRAQLDLRTALALELHRPILFPVPPSGRALEMAIWLYQQEIDGVGLDSACLATLQQMMSENDGSLKASMVGLFEEMLMGFIIPISLYVSGRNTFLSLTHLPTYLLAGDPDGQVGMAGQLRQMKHFKHHTLFTGYCNQAAKASINAGEASFSRWNVHPTKRCLERMVDILQCRYMMPLFTDIGSSSRWSQTFAREIIAESVSYFDALGVRQQAIVIC